MRMYSCLLAMGHCLSQLANCIHASLLLDWYALTPTTFRYYSLCVVASQECIRASMIFRHKSGIVTCYHMKLLRCQAPLGHIFEAFSAARLHLTTPITTPRQTLDRGRCRAAMESVIIDPRGDVCFIAGTAGADTKVSFLVKSHVLTLASDVFATLLGGGFSEGNALAQSTSSPSEIALPEDDAVSRRPTEAPDLHLATNTRSPPRSA
jgi:hypothetical protein